MTAVADAGVCRTWRNDSFRVVAWLWALVLTPAAAVMLLMAPGSTWVTGAISGAVLGVAASIVWAVYGITDVVLCGHRIVVRNPFRTIDIPVGSLVSIEAGDRLHFHLVDGTVIRAWAVQAANMSLMLKRESHVDRVATEIRAALTSLPPGDDDIAAAERTPDLGFFWKAIIGGAVVLGLAAMIVT